MYDFLVKRGEMLAFGLGIILVLIFLFTAIPGLDSFNALPEDQQNQSDIFNVGLYLAMILGVITALTAIVFGLLQLVTNPKGSIKILVGLAVLAVVFGIFYATAEVETTGSIVKAAADFDVNDNTSKLITAGIMTAISLSVVSVVAFIGAELYNAFK